MYKTGDLDAFGNGDSSNKTTAIFTFTIPYLEAVKDKKEVQDEENPGNNKIIPSLMNSAAYGLCAKASFVWYTKIEQESKVDPATNQVATVQNYVTYIDSCQAYLSKTRKPKEMNIPLSVKNLTYAKFKKNILDIVMKFLN